MSTDQARADLVGGGFASLAAAVLLIRNRGVRGHNIRIIKELPVAGGALDGSADPMKGATCCASCKSSRASTHSTEYGARRSTSTTLWSGRQRVAREAGRGIRVPHKGDR